MFCVESQAEDKGTPSRNLKYFSSKVGNMINTSMEYTDTMISSALLKYKSYRSTHNSIVHKLTTNASKCIKHVDAYMSNCTKPYNSHSLFSEKTYTYKHHLSQQNHTNNTDSWLRKLFHMAGNRTPRGNSRDHGFVKCQTRLNGTCNEIIYAHVGLFQVCL